MSPTLFQTDLGITDHRRHKFAPSLTLLSVQSAVQYSNRMASRFTTIASFSCVFLQLVQCSRQHPSFSAHPSFSLPCICPVIDHRGRQNVVRTPVTHSAIASCASFLFLPHFYVICDLLLDKCTATWNLFVKQNKFI